MVDGVGVFFPGTGSSFLLQLDTNDKASGQATFSQFTVGLSTTVIRRNRAELLEELTSISEPIKSPVTSTFQRIREGIAVLTMRYSSIIRPPDIASSEFFGTSKFGSIICP